MALGFTCASDALIGPKKQVQVQSHTHYKGQNLDIFYFIEEDYVEEYEEFEAPKDLVFKDFCFYSQEKPSIPVASLNSVLEKHYRKKEANRFSKYPLFIRYQVFRI